MADSTLDPDCLPFTRGRRAGRLPDQDHQIRNPHAMSKLRHDVRAATKTRRSDTRRYAGLLDDRLERPRG